MEQSERYFNQIIHSIKIDDIAVLGVLYDNEATAPFKAIRNLLLFEKSKMSEAKYRKTLNRLIAIKFVDTDTTNKEHLLYITEYGVVAYTTMLGNS